MNSKSLAGASANKASKADSGADRQSPATHGGRVAEGAGGAGLDGGKAGANPVDAKMLLRNRVASPSLTRHPSREQRSCQ
jgi:hypothetical protein